MFPMSLKIMLHGRLQERVAEAAGPPPCSVTPERSRRVDSNAVRPLPRWQCVTNEPSRPAAASSVRLLIRLGRARPSLVLFSVTRP